MHQISTLRTRLVQVFPALLGIVLFGLSVWAISQELHKYRIQEIFQNIAAISRLDVGLAIAFTGVNYLIFTGYDTLALRFIRHPLPYRRTALVATISYAISNTVGFTLLSGSAIRYRFYSRWGFSAVEVAQIVAFCNLSFWLGMFALSGLLFLIEPLDVPDVLNLPFDSAHSIGFGCLVIVLAYLIWNAVSSKSLRIKSFVLPHVPLKLSLAQIAVTSLDWACGVGVLYTLLPAMPLSYLGFFGIYLLAQMAGVLSNVPGGLGVVETVMLLLLSPSVAPATLLGALLAFRGIYFFLPLLVAVLVLGLYEIRLRFLKQPG